MSELNSSNEDARHARRDERLRRAGSVIGRAISSVMLVGGVAICVVTLYHTDGRSWTTVSIASIFLGGALRGLWSVLDLSKRNARLAVPLAYVTAIVFAVSGSASLGALLTESVVPAIFLAPAAFGMAAFLVFVARQLSSDRNAA
jgi:FtsH-binding integral membrane protein